MANTVNLLSYANTYGDWMLTTNQLVKENNDFASSLYAKNSGTLYLNDPTLGLQVTSNAIFASQMQVQGLGSGAYIQNKLRVDGSIELTNTSVALTSSGIIYANSSNTGLVVSNNAIITGNLTILGRLFSTQGDVTTYVDEANTFLQANDRTTLTAAKSYTDNTNTAIYSSINTGISTATANVRTLIDANNAMAYVRGIVVGDGGFSVGGSGSASGGLSLDGTTISNSSIIFPIASSPAFANASIVRTRGGGAVDAEIKWSASKGYWEVSDISNVFPTVYDSGQYTFSRLLTSQILTDSLTMDFSSPSRATYVASANAANALNTSIQTNLIYANAAFAAANAAYALANSGYNAANNAVDTFARVQSNAAFDKANSANVLAQDAYNQANTGLSTALLAYDAANNALDIWVRGQANNAVNIAQSAYAYANSVGVYSNAAYARANTSLNFVVGTSGTASPNDGILSFASGNGVTITGSSNVLTVSTPQDLRTTGNVNFFSLELTTALPVTQGGTGATTSLSALDSLLPASTGQGQVLATNGQGSYYWTAANSVASPFSSLGSTIRTSRIANTRFTSGSQTVFTVPFYTPGSGQLRVYLDGVRQMPSSDYTETNSTTLTMANTVPYGTNLLFEVDGFSNTTFFANNIAFSPNTLYTGVNANTIQLAIDALIANVAWRNNTVISNVSFSANATAVTAQVNTSNTLIATTAFVKNVLNSGNTFAISISGNAGTVTNGVYTNQSYANPSFITSIANTKIDGLIRSSQIANVTNTQITGLFSSANLTTLITNPNVQHGNATFTPVVTVDAAGRVTAISNVAMAIPASSVSGLKLSSANLTATGVTAGQYGNTTLGVTFTVDANGRITGASNLIRTVANTQVIGLFSSANLTLTGVGAGQYGNATFIPTITVDTAGRVTAISTNVATVPLADLITTANAANSYGSTSNGVTIRVDTKGRITSITNTIITIANTQVTGLFSSANLTATGVTAGQYGNSVNYPIFTVDASGRVTSVTNTLITVANTRVTGLFSSANLTATGVVAATHGTANTVPVIAVDAQGRVTTVTNTLITIANTRVTGLFSSANLTTTGVTAATYGNAGVVPVFAVDAQGRVTTATNTPISLSTANLTGTITAAQLGTTSLPQFTSIGIGVAANTSCTSITVAQNGFLRVGNTYLSSGGDYAHISAQSWFNGSGWVASAAVPHVLYQLSGNNVFWYRGSASLTPTYTPAMLLNTGSGDLTVSGNVTAYGTVSDIRMKENIIRLDGAMDKLSSINGYYFNYKTDENKSRLIGVIAQEVEQVLPELVYEFNQIDSNEITKAVRYEHLTAVLVEAIKELKQEIKDLKQEVDVLKGK
jgi:hypothetical protein